jgi:pimeloyl-ACP methyl ester carboxylesterase
MTQPMHRQEPSEGYIHVSEGKLHYLDWDGAGRQIHFLHANGFCAGTYTPFLNHLTGTFRVFASDVRGHGDSTFPQTAKIRKWDVFAEDLKAVVEGAMTPPVIGMGHSLGAVTTCMAAARYSQLFSAIVLLDPVFLAARTRWRDTLIRMLGLRSWLPLARGARQRKRTFADKQSALRRFAAGRGIFKSWSADFIEAYLECGLLEHDADRAILRCDPELEAQIFETVPLNVWQTVAQVECPILAIRGEQSDTFLPEAGRRLEQTAADARVAAIPRAGHFLPMERPEETAKIIADFIDRKLPGGPSH